MCAALKLHAVLLVDVRRAQDRVSADMSGKRNAGMVSIKAVYTIAGAYSPATGTKVKSLGGARDKLDIAVQNRVVVCAHLPLINTGITNQC